MPSIYKVFRQITAIETIHTSLLEMDMSVLVPLAKFKIQATLSIHERR